MVYYFYALCAYYVLLCLSGKALVFVERSYCACLVKFSEKNWSYKLREKNIRNFITFFK